MTTVELPPPYRSPSFSPYPPPSPPRSPRPARATSRSPRPPRSPSRRTPSPRTPSPRYISRSLCAANRSSDPLLQKQWDAYFDALLADLQNTISPNSSTVANSSSPTTSGYGSLNGTRVHQSSDMLSSHTGTTRVVTETYEYRTEGTPVYSNQQLITETGGPIKATSYQQSTTQMSAFNNNLSELDTLLQDLNNARYTGYLDKKGEWGRRLGRPPSIEPMVLNVVNGTSTPSPKSPSNVEARPTVDSLLDELNTAVPSSDVIDGPKKETPLTTEPYKEEGNPSASTATKELDDLMASLSDFKINASTLQTQTVSEPPYAKPEKPQKAQSGPNKSNQLDSMLGNLQADMSKQGVNTTQKGCCSACEKPIVGQVITALGKTWHPEHFVCAHCNSELGTKNFFERDGQPYCETDYHNLFSPRCAYCNGPILDKCVTALEKTWHPEHFFCAQCGNQFGDDGFHEKDGKPYCKDDYFEMFAPKCGGCNRPIMENYISALSSQWHPECFVCRDCQQPFHGGSFFDHEGLPYCETHYHAKRGSLCAGCHKPISGRCITAMFRKFHPEHFVCSFCLKQLNKGTFKEQNDKPYCHCCFDKLFG